MIIKSYLYQILSAINYIHNKGIIHRLLDPDNIMLTDNFKTIKIRDFSICSMISIKENKK